MNNTIATNFKIVNSATQFKEKLATNYARASTPIGPNPLITGNKTPWQSRLRWLTGLPKCNQFVGDVLTVSGFKAPLYRMKDGTYHYRHAEGLLRSRDSLTSIGQLSQVRAGDIIVIDYPKRHGEQGAHVEIVAQIDAAKRSMKLIGAVDQGLREQDFSLLLRRLRPAKNGFFDPKTGNSVYFLRPIKVSEEGLGN